MHQDTTPVLGDTKTLPTVLGEALSEETSAMRKQDNEAWQKFNRAFDLLCGSEMSAAMPHAWVQRGYQPQLDGHTSSTESILPVDKCYESTGTNVLVTLQGPDDPTPRRLESSQLSANEATSDSKTATTNGSPCPLPHENHKPRSITTSGDEHEQEWGSHKLRLDGHTSLPHTNS